MPLEVGSAKRDMPRVNPRRHERDGIWRLCGWGASAVVAVGALALATQADTAGRLDHVSGAAAKPAVVAQVPPPKDPDTLRLEAEVRRLASDREQLAARFANLERHLDEVTGSIQRAVASAPATPTPPSPPPAAAEPPTAAPAPQAAAPPPPALRPPKVGRATSAPAATPAPVAAAPAIPAYDPLARPSVVASIGWPQTPVETDEDEPAEAPVVVPKLEMREVPAAPKPLAALPVQQAVPPSVPKPAHGLEFGIDLGGAKSMDILRERWTSIKANLGPLLTGLQPIAVRDRKPGSTELRLVVGPMPSLSAAHQVCARFAAAHVACHASRFDGEAVVQR